MERLIILVIGYFIGAILQGAYWIARFKHVDIREHGSGNPGTTNMMRTMGKKLGALTFIVDAFKAIITCTIAYFMYREQGSGMVLVYFMYGGLGAILGHNFPFYLKFKGGKGIAATSGVILSLIPYNPWFTLIGLVVFFGTMYSSKYVSLASLTLMTTFLIEMIIFGQCGYFSANQSQMLEVYGITFVIVVLAFIKHAPNIKRLVSGTERKIGQKKTEVNNG